MEEMFPKEIYEELINLLKLMDITTAKCAWERNSHPRKFAEINALDLEIERGKLEAIFEESTLIIPAAYRISGKPSVTDKATAERVFSFETILEVHFTSDRMDRVKEILSIEELGEFFFGYQIDKFIWPYLRHSFSQACGATGKRTFTLPMMQ